MKKIIVALFALAFLSLLYFNSHYYIESQIEKEIEKANYCNIDSDCVDAGSKCPFGCYAYVNKAEVERISGLIDAYESRCVYGCVSCPSALCIDKKCVPQCDQ